MQEIKGYFKIEHIKPNGEIESTYEDFNTVMVRIPTLMASMISGSKRAFLPYFHIHAFAIGTDGTFQNDFGDDIPKTVSKERTQMFSEENFWRSQVPDSPEFKKNEELKRVYQRTFEAPPVADTGGNPATMRELFGGNQGSTLPHTDFHPTEYRGPLNWSGGVYDGSYLRVEQSNLNTEIIYVMEVGQKVANKPNNALVKYNEAALYLKLGANESSQSFDPDTGNPLGELFSMKTFPLQRKSTDCAIRITWKLYF